jgi:hypothetical protein
MKIPPDYLIEYQVIQIHFWLVIQQLRKLDTHITRYIAYQL